MAYPDINRIATEVIYNGTTLTLPSPNLQNKSETITTNTTTTIRADNGYDGLDTVTITTQIPTHEGEPIEINTAAGMNAVLVAANVGKVYRFTGTTDSTYTNGDLYEVEEVT